jgi:protein CrcB
MNPALVAVVLVAGALGAMLRYGVTLLAGPRRGEEARIPWAVLVVNVVGSAIAGVVLGLGSALGTDIQLILLTGFAGGLTTFSTFTVETVQLAIDGRARSALASVAANLVLGVGAAALAFALTASVVTGGAGDTARGSFPTGAAADYQLGGAYDPPDGTGLVVRDSTADPAAGLYSVCYVNGFQTQPGEDWPGALVLQEDGEAIVDPDWPDERILDISSEEKRGQILERMEPVIADCAERGFQAVEFDNLDTYTRFDALTQEHAIAFATGLVELTHEAGLAAAQKNSAELAAIGRDTIGFDFAVAEECDRYEECAAYTDVYGGHVVAIEYTDAQRRDFGEICADPARPATMLLRDRDLVTPDDPAYHLEQC